MVHDNIHYFFDPTILEAGAEILKTISLVFWLKRWHQKVLLKLPDRYIKIPDKNLAKHINVEWSRTDWWCTTLFMMHILMSLKVESWNDVNDGWISHYGNKGGRTQPFDRGNFLLLIGIRMWHPWWTTAQHTALVLHTMG